MISSYFARLLRRQRPNFRSFCRPTAIFTVGCLQEVKEQFIEPEILGVEAIVYLLGITNGETSLAVSGVKPKAESTPRSFDVGSAELGKVVRLAAETGLQVVGQIHSHPRFAFHSAGDLKGMRIRFPGYFSIVIPDYGACLPSLERTHTVMWTSNGFQDVVDSVRIFGRPK